MNTERRVDIAVLCHNAQTLVNLATPFTKSTKALDKFRKWESPILCIALMVMATCSSIVLSWFHLLLLNLALIGGLAGIGLAHLRGNILLKVLPAAVVADTAGMYCSELPAPSHTDTMHQFKEILYLTDSVVLAIARMIEKLYSVIKWDNFHHSVRCYSTAAVVVIMFHILPLKYTAALCVDAFVIYYPLKSYISEKYFGIPDTDDPCVSHMTQSDPDTVSISQASLPSEDEEMDDDMSSEKCESSREASDAEVMEFGEEQQHHQQQQEDPHIEEEEVDSELLEQYMSVDGEGVKSRESEGMRSSSSQSRLESAAKHRSDIRLSGESTESAGSDNGSLELTRSGGQLNKATGVVGRLIEFKRKQQQANTGTCCGCGVTFSTILKRKKNCANCGNCFCSKCCSYKVAKFMLGVTSPTAQADQVLVCGDCHGSVTSMDPTDDLSKVKMA